jgi:hypothetical protein
MTIGQITTSLTRSSNRLWNISDWVDITKDQPADQLLNFQLDDNVITEFERNQPSYWSDWCQRDTSLAVEVDFMTTDLQTDHVKIPDQVAVRDYLLMYPDLVGVVRYAASQTRKLFNTGTELSLEVFNSQEDDDKFLALYVRQKPYERDIMEKIDEVGEEINPMMTFSSGWFVVVTDFRFPKAA